MKKMAVVLFTSLFGISLSASAQEGGFMPWTDVMMEADADKSGGVSMSEIKNYRLGERFQGFQPWMADHFAELDADGNGEINLTELKSASMKMKMSDAELSSGFYRGFGFMPGNQ